MIAKMTAVEYLYKFLYEMESFEGFDAYSFNQEDVFNKAKQMEKQQIIEAMDVCQRTDFYVKYEDGEQYYNETFKTN